MRVKMSRSKRIVMTVFVAVLMITLLGMTAQSVYAQQKKYVFYFPSHIGGADPNMKVWMKAIEDFGELYPVDIKYFATTQFSMEKFKEFVETSVAANPDGILLPIVDPEPIEEPLKRAIQKGIPVMALNIPDPRPESERIPYLGFVGEDSIATGRALAKRVLKEFRPKHAVAAVALIGHVSLEQRAQGFVAEMEANGVKALRLATGANEAHAKETLTAYLMGNADVDVVFSTATYNTPWTWFVLSQLRKTEDIAVVSVDASPTSLEAVANWGKDDPSIPKALATHSQNMYMQVWYSAEALYIYNKFGGMEPPTQISTGPLVIDSSNVNAWITIIKKLFGEKPYQDNVLW